MRRLLFFLAFSFSFAVGVWVNQAGRQRDVYRSVCDLSEEHFFKADQKFAQWINTCRRRAHKFPLFGSKSALLSDIQSLMNELEVSHFQIYDPTEDKRLWKGESLDTGIRARFVEDALVVYRVLPESSAHAAEVRVGDVIVAIEGAEQVTPWGAMRRSGVFRIHRGQTSIDLQIEARELVEDMSPRLRAFTPQVAWLEIPSFRADFFAKDDWMRVVDQLSRFSHVVVDVRDNSGGNFVAMLRGLSTFLCRPKSVGEIVQPRKRLSDLDAFPDELDDAKQIELLEKYRSIGLRTFAQYGCYNGRVTVLVGPDTSSVAEIFAFAFTQRAQARVWGQPTAGDVVLAVWYDLPLLGEGYSFSIPEAVYRTPQGAELEGMGVFPQKELFYDLPTELKGLDTWVQLATGVGG